MVIKNALLMIYLVPSSTFNSVGQRYNIMYRYYSDFTNIVSLYRNLFDIDIVSNYILVFDYFIIGTPKS